MDQSFPGFTKVLEAENYTQCPCLSFVSAHKDCLHFETCKLGALKT